jgi:hypothetical protein
MESCCEDARQLLSEFLEIVSEGSIWCYNLRADPLEPNCFSNLLDVESEFVDELLELTGFLIYREGSFIFRHKKFAQWVSSQSFPIENQKYSPRSAGKVLPFIKLGTGSMKPEDLYNPDFNIREPRKLRKVKKRHLDFYRQSRI